MSHPHLSHVCAAFQAALEVLSRPWTGLVLRCLQEGPLRYTELAQQLEHVGDKTLSVRLRELEARGLVERRVDAGPPVRVEYELTAKGKGFRHVVAAIEKWGQSFASESPPVKEKKKEKEKVKEKASPGKRRAKAKSSPVKSAKPPRAGRGGT